MKKIFLISLVCFILTASSVFGLVTLSQEQEHRAKEIGAQLRCPVCRGVPISESPATLAQQMMELVREQVAENKSDAEIFSYFEERYGEWALLQPKPRGMTLVIWILPALFLVVGAFFIIIRFKNKERHKTVE